MVRLSLPGAPGSRHPRLEQHQVREYRVHLLDQEHLRVLLLRYQPTSLPAENFVTVDVSEKDYLGIITVTFQGGMGMNSIKKVDVKLTRADGSTQTATVGTKKGDEVELQGTRGSGSERGPSDRVEVWVTTNQVQTYKIVDVLREYRSRG